MYCCCDCGCDSVECTMPYMFVCLYLLDIFFAEFVSLSFQFSILFYFNSTFVCLSAYTLREHFSSVSLFHSFFFLSRRSIYMVPKITNFILILFDQHQQQQQQSRTRHRQRRRRQKSEYVSSSIRCSVRLRGPNDVLKMKSNACNRRQMRTSVKKAQDDTIEYSKNKKKKGTLPEICKFEARHTTKW